MQSAANATFTPTKTGVFGQITSLDSIQQIGLSKVWVFVASLLFASYVLRMTAIPWPLPKDATNYVGIMVAFAMAMLAGKPRIVSLYVLALLATLPSVLVSPNVEDSGLRWIGWALLIVAVGPPLAGPTIFRFRFFLLMIFLAFIHLASIGSGILGAFGIQAPGGRGPFWGLLSHSNILGTLSSLAAVDSFFKWSSRNTKRSKILWFSILVIELFTSVRAASRAALIGFFVCGIVIAYCRDSKSKSQMFVMLLVLLATGVSYQLVRDSEHRTTAKNGSLVANLATKGLTNTRQDLWNDRLREFESKPAFGVGFCMGGTEGMRVRKDGFMQEPGSSYLAAFSMSGIVGGIGFLVLISPLFVSAIALARNRYGPEPPFYAISALFWLVAMSTEGFSHYVGHPFCFAILLWSGVAADAQKLFPNQDPLKANS